MKKSIKKFKAQKQLEVQSLKQINGGGISFTFATPDIIENKEAAGKEREIGL